MSLANPLWGAPRIHGELLKLGIDVGQTTVAKYMARGRRPPSQGWMTFLDNHADGIASMDLSVVPTISFRLVYRLLILQHDRRQILWLGVTAHPTAEWISRQLTEPYGWNVEPRYIIRDRDAVYGEVFIRRFRAMGTRDRPTAARSPWQNGYCEKGIRLSCQKPGVRACRPVEHPGRHFKRPICLRLFQRAAEDDKTILVDGTMNANSTKPRMMPIKNLAKNGPVGVLKPRCIKRLARTFQSTRTRRHREQHMPLVAFLPTPFLGGLHQLHHLYVRV
jgi:hypothetical protein